MAANVFVNNNRQLTRWVEIFYIGELQTNTPLHWLQRNNITVGPGRNTTGEILDCKYASNNT